MAFVEMTAKTVDEAVAKALKELNITAEEAVVEVLEEGKKGFLGMFSSSHILGNKQGKGFGLSV